MGPWCYPELGLLSMRSFHAWAPRVYEGLLWVLWLPSNSEKHASRCEWVCEWCVPARAHSAKCHSCLLSHCSWDKVQLQHNPDLNKALTKDEWMNGSIKGWIFIFVLFCFTPEIDPGYKKKKKVWSWEALRLKQCCNQKWKRIEETKPRHLIVQV